MRREVESLLANATKADDFLGPSALAAAAHVVVGPYSATLTGRQIGSYEIGTQLGAGGMGEVYRARDTKLGRDVAIKVLPPAFTADRERLARFEREARVLASLNHPNIGAIYGVEEFDGLHALVLELVEGDTLDARLTARAPSHSGARGSSRTKALAVAEALAIARQIADGLEAAHEKGIVHRDLKPANIKVTPSGTVKVLDFGLAKSGSGSAPDLSHSPTITISGTREGALLGTAAYMSPEQARGQAVDKRADIWAFGCVLYEMLTGRVPFSGDTVSDHIAAILDREPDWHALPASTAASVRRLLRRCLEKDPRRRLHDIADARIEIEDALAGGPSPAVPPTWKQSAPLAWSVAALALTAATALSGWVAWSARAPRAPAAQALTRFVIQPRESAPAVDGFDISPDGRQIVYVGRQGGVTRLFLQRLDQFEAAPIAGTEGAFVPFFSRDGQWVAYFAAGKLQKVNVREPAAPVVLCTLVDAGNTYGAWMDNAVLFTGRNHGVMRVPADGGEPEALTSLDSTREIDHHTPDVLPGGQALLFAIHRAEDRFSIVVESIATHRRKVLIESGFAPHYLPPDHIVFARGSAILAVPFDVDRLEVTAGPVTLVDHVQTSSRNGEGGFALSGTGTLVFAPERPIDGRRLVWVGRDGAETPLPIAPRGFRTPRVSPDGRTLAFAVRDGDRHDLWTYDIAADKLTRVTSQGNNLAPLWTHDAQRLSYTSIGDDGPHLMWQPSDGSGQPESLLNSRNLLWPSAWTADNRALVYVEQPPTDEPWISILRLDPDRRGERLIQGDGRQPSLAPDGRWLAFGSGDVPPAQVYVVAFPSVSSRRQVTVDGGREPKWRPDGRELFYRSTTRVFAVAVDTTSRFSVGKPAMLFEGRYINDFPSGLDYDVAPEGRFLMIEPGEEELRPTQLNLVVNWGNELARRVPARK